MEAPIVERVSRLLRDASNQTLTLARLHVLLGPGTPRVDALADLLAAHPAFVVTAPVDPFDGLPIAGAAAVLDAYRRALRAHAADEVRVGLRGTAPMPRIDAFGLLESSLHQLRTAHALPGLADRIAEARAEYGALALSVPPQPA